MMLSGERSVKEESFDHIDIQSPFLCVECDDLSLSGARQKVHVTLGSGHYLRQGGD